MTGRGALEGQRAVVTGASSGIGAATAVELARRGATVGLVARRSDKLAAVLDLCRQHTPDSRQWTVDLADLAAVDALAARAVDELGGVDILVNNAGVPKRRRVADLSVDDLEAVLRINFVSPVRLTTALLPHLLARGTGHVVNVSSMGAHSAAYRTAAYTASKAALEMFTEALHLELAGTGVRVHLFVPGSTATEFSTPKPGNDPPFPHDPALVASPADVAAALADCIATESFLTFARASDRAVAEQKNADVNRFVAAMAQRFARIDERA